MPCRYLYEAVRSAARDPSLGRIPGQAVELRAIGNGYLLAQVDEHLELLPTDTFLLLCPLSPSLLYFPPPLCSACAAVPRVILVCVRNPILEGRLAVSAYVLI